MKKTTKALCVLLAAVLVISLIPASVLPAMAGSGKKITSVTFYDKNPDPRAEGEIKDYPAVSVAYTDAGGSNDMELLTLKEVASQEEAKNVDFGMEGYCINGKWYKVVALWTINPDTDIIDKGAGHKVAFTPLYFSASEKPAAGEKIFVALYDNVEKVLSNAVAVTMPQEGESTQADVAETGTPKAALNKSAFVYDGKVKTPAVVVKDGDKTLKKGEDYTVVYQRGRVNAGTYNIKVTFIGDYSGSQLLSFKIVKAANTLLVKGKTVKVSRAKVKKAKQVIARAKAIAIARAQGKLVFAKVAGSKRLSINKKTGNITVAKGTKKGVYSITVYIGTAGNTNYNKVIKAVKVKVVVK